eukprot:1715510-Rhodomonas_salina.1
MVLASGRLLRRCSALPTHLLRAVRGTDSGLTRRTRCAGTRSRSTSAWQPTGVVTRRWSSTTSSPRSRPGPFPYCSAFLDAPAVRFWTLLQCAFGRYRGSHSGQPRVPLWASPVPFWSRSGRAWRLTAWRLTRESAWAFQFSESLLIAQEVAREGISARIKERERQQRMEKEKKDEEMRQLARDARMMRTGAGAVSGRDAAVNGCSESVNGCSESVNGCNEGVNGCSESVYGGNERWLAHAAVWARCEHGWIGAAVYGCDESVSWGCDASVYGCDALINDCKHRHL